MQNEKYIGDALLQKTYTVDFLSKKRVKNNGIVPQYYVENSHEPIIPRELFMQVQEEMVRRANLRGRKGGKKRVYSSKYALSSIVYCGHCGDIYRRVHWNNRGYKSIVWRCVIRKYNGGFIPATQNIADWNANEELRSKTSAILKNSQYTFIFKLSAPDMKDVLDVYKAGDSFNGDEQRMIISAVTGQVFFVGSTELRTCVKITTGEYIKSLFEEKTGENYQKGEVK